MESERYTQQQMLDSIQAIAECHEDKITVPMSILKNYYPELFLKAYQKSYQKAYRKTDKYKAYKKAYRKTDKYKAYLKAYYKTDKHKSI